MFQRFRPDAPGGSPPRVVSQRGPKACPAHAGAPESSASLPAPSLRDAMKKKRGWEAEGEAHASRMRVVIAGGAGTGAGTNSNCYGAC